MFNLLQCCKNRRLSKSNCQILAYVVVVACFMFTTYSSAVWSDQNDTRLDDLFDQLLLEEDQNIGNEITDLIWDIWIESPNGDVNELMNAGIAAMSSGRLDQAVAIFDQVVEIAPGFAEGWNKRATVHYFMQNYQKSASDVKKTLVLEPRHFGATAGLGLILLELRYYESALEAFEKALEINPHLAGPKIQVKRLKRYLKEYKKYHTSEEPSV